MFSKIAKISKNLLKLWVANYFCSWSAV